MYNYKIDHDKVPPISEMSLELALYIYTTVDKNKSINELALQTIIYYIIYNNKEDVICPEEITKEVIKISGNYVLESLIKKGKLDVLVDENGEISYKANKK